MNKPLQLNTMEDIRENHNLGFYAFKEERPNIKKLPEDFIFDENMSIKENRRMVKENNESYEEQMKAYNQRYYDKINEFNNDMITVIIKELNVSEEKAKKIYSYIYREAHSSGGRSLIDFAEDFIEFLSTII